jgi:hypothetical protein
MVKFAVVYFFTELGLSHYSLSGMFENLLNLIEFWSKLKRTMKTLNRIGKLKSTCLLMICILK